MFKSIGESLNENSEALEFLNRMAKLNSPNGDIYDGGKKQTKSLQKSILSDFTDLPDMIVLSVGIKAVKRLIMRRQNKRGGNYVVACKIKKLYRI